ncbi:class I SAM-dependent methyltransferase [Microvirga terricola]|uniref:Methyltransferase domain-containing protein n=1 Tax=Microvirga terricola TaxID=2719797 RepID=A0ABX0V6X5_9HYPH|nr:class I SAM-dependent methyltransferase [Microvirga terricola]NIX75333.1 methyltransferase domain-containing protein [Microvirga terricola]
MTGAKERLEMFRDLLAEARRALDLSFGFELWDGSTVPVDLAPHAMRLVIARESVIASLLRRPTLDTVINAHVAGLLDLKNGTIFDLAAQRPRGKVARQLRGVSKLKALKTAFQFLKAPANMPRPLDGVKDNPDARDGKPETNKRNVAYHYDVSNEFYQLFLDPEMVYTCAYFTPDWHNDIAKAQFDKLDMICRKLRLQPGERFLDIGCGWGALICHAAQHYGVKATGVTLAEEQAKIAREKIARLGLQERVKVVLKDYTQMEGEFDKISSIGMFEQVGLRNHAEYFSSVNRLLRPRGLYLHHTIARRAKRSDKAFQKLKPEYKALTRYIFPGGELDHLGMSVANLERHGFEVHDVEAWREHYQHTTRLWWENLNARRAEAEALVGPEKTRMWLIYLAGCSLAFERAAVGVNQTLASKRTRGPAGLPSTRADLYSSTGSNQPR